MSCQEVYGENTPCESCDRVGEEDLLHECRVAFRSWLQISALERRSGWGVEPLGYMTMKQICYDRDISQEVFDFMLLIEGEFMRIRREEGAKDKEDKPSKKGSKDDRSKNRNRKSRV